MKDRNRFSGFLRFTICVFFLALSVYLLSGKYSGHVLALFAVFAVILVAGGWSSMRDVLAGIFLRIENQISVGDYILLNNLSGRVQLLGLRCLSLKKDDGPYVFVPYSTVAKEIVTRLPPSEQTDPYTFSLVVPKIAKPGAMREIIRKAALNLIWVSLKTDPRIQFLEEKEDGFLFEVTVYPVISEYGARIEDFLKAELAA
ncbi:MAG: mechanosensitive ion channel family protein [Proteobacteria bacterium]|nr:mechanosensitive ion channel family protein [Pseudomonadota bacterium]